jgi:SagB-type dehydrogenase family enzyme
MLESLDEAYILNSKNLLFYKKNKKAHQFHYDKSILHLMENAYNVFYNTNQIELPAPDDAIIGNVPFLKVLTNRKSIRNYLPEPLSLKELSNLLFYSAGSRRTESPRRRYVPTGGNLNSTDIFFFSLRIDGLSKGFYHYDFINHKLNIIKQDDFDDIIKNEILYQPELASAPLLIILVANLSRVKFKYGIRAFRIVHMDCGALMQNLYLVAEALGLGSCAIGGVIEYKIEELLDINGVDHVVLIAHSVGKVDPLSSY